MPLGSTPLAFLFKGPLSKKHKRRSAPKQTQCLGASSQDAVVCAESAYANRCSNAPPLDPNLGGAGCPAESLQRDPSPVPEGDSETGKITSGKTFHQIDDTCDVHHQHNCNARGDKHMKHGLSLVGAVEGAAVAGTEPLAYSDGGGELELNTSPGTQSSSQSDWDVMGASNASNAIDADADDADADPAAEVAGASAADDIALAGASPPFSLPQQESPVVPELKSELPSPTQPDVGVYRHMLTSRSAVLTPGATLAAAAAKIAMTGPASAVEALAKQSKSSGKLCTLSEPGKSLPSPCTPQAENDHISGPVHLSLGAHHLGISEQTYARGSGDSHTPALSEMSVLLHEACEESLHPAAMQSQVPASPSLSDRVRFIQERVDALTNEELMSPVGLQRLSSSLQHSNVHTPPGFTTQPSQLHVLQSGKDSFSERKLWSRSSTNNAGLGSSSHLDCPIMSSAGWNGSSTWFSTANAPALGCQRQHQHQHHQQQHQWHSQPLSSCRPAAGGSLSGATSPGKDGRKPLSRGINTSAALSSTGLRAMPMSGDMSREGPNVLSSELAPGTSSSNLAGLLGSLGDGSNVASTHQHSSSAEGLHITNTSQVSKPAAPFPSSPVKVQPLSSHTHLSSACRPAARGHQSSPRPPHKFNIVDAVNEFTASASLPVLPLTPTSASHRATVPAIRTEQAPGEVSAWAQQHTSHSQPPQQHGNRTGASAVSLEAGLLVPAAPVASAALPTRFLETDQEQQRHKLHVAPNHSSSSSSKQHDQRAPLLHNDSLQWTFSSSYTNSAHQDRLGKKQDRQPTPALDPATNALVSSQAHQQQQQQQHRQHASADPASAWSERSQAWTAAGAAHQAHHLRRESGGMSADPATLTANNIQCLNGTKQPDLLRSTLSEQEDHDSHQQILSHQHSRHLMHTAKAPPSSLSEKFACTGRDNSITKHQEVLRDMLEPPCFFERASHASSCFRSEEPVSGTNTVLQSSSENVQIRNTSVNSPSSADDGWAATHGVRAALAASKAVGLNAEDEAHLQGVLSKLMQREEQHHHQRHHPQSPSTQMHYHHHQQQQQQQPHPRHRHRHPQRHHLTQPTPRPPHALLLSGHSPQVASAHTPLATPFAIHPMHTNAAGSSLGSFASPPHSKAPPSASLFHTSLPHPSHTPLTNHPGMLGSPCGGSPTLLQTVGPQHASYAASPWGSCRAAGAGQGALLEHMHNLHRQAFMPRSSVPHAAHVSGNKFHPPLASHASPRSLHGGTVGSQSSTQGWEWATDGGGTLREPLRCHQHQQQQEQRHVHLQQLPRGGSCGLQHQGSADVLPSSLRQRKLAPYLGANELAVQGQGGSTIMSRASSGLVFPESSSPLWQRDSGSMLPMPAAGGTVQVLLLVAGCVIALFNVFMILLVLLNTNVLPSE